MTALSDQCDVIRGWLNLGPDVYPDAVVTSWIRMCESILGKELRCKEMVQIDTGLLVKDRYLLPSDWRALDFIRTVPGKPLRYASRDDYYNPDNVDDQPNCYTISGNYLIVGGTDPINGTTVEITYYQSLPPLNDVQTWPLIQYPTMFTLKTLSVASSYALEDARGDRWDAQASKLIDEINAEHMRSKASGSRLTLRHHRSFG